MYGFEDKTVLILEENRYRKNERIVALLMSVVMVIAVISNLIMPAVSATDMNELNGTGSEKITAEFRDGVHDFTKIISPTVVTIAKNKNGTEIITPDPDNKDKLEVGFDFMFLFQDGEMTERYLYCEIDGDFEMIDGSVQSIYDTKDLWQNSPRNPNTGADAENSRSLSGYFKVIKTGGRSYLLVEFLKEYQEVNTEDHSAIDGKVEFKANVDRGANDSAVVNFNNGSFSLEIPEDRFPQRELNGYKSASVSEDGSSVTWTIDINNYTNETSITVTDAMFALSSNGVTFTDENGSPLAAANNGDGSYTLTSGNDTGLTKARAEYTTPLPVPREFFDSDDAYNDYILEGRLRNTADITAGPENITRTSEVYGLPSAGVSKTAESVDYNERKAVWKITIDNPAGSQLKDFILKDDRFADAENGEITIDPQVSYSFRDETRKNQLVLGETTAQTITVTYTTPLNEAGETRNDVSLQKPGSPDWMYSIKNSGYTVKEQYEIQKYGSLDKVNNKIGWTIRLYKYDDEASWDDVLTDSMFANADAPGVTLSYGETSQTVTAAGNGIDLAELNIPDETGEITVTYYTDIDALIGNMSEEEKAQINTDGGIRFTNTAGYGGYSASTEVVRKHENQVTKRRTGIRQKDGKIYINWEIEIRGYAGKFYGTEYELRDIMTAETSNGTVLKHELDTDFLALPMGSGAENESYDYNIALECGADFLEDDGTPPACDTFNKHFYVLMDDLLESADNFRIYFSQIEKNKSLTAVKLNYTTVIDISKVAAGTKVNFTNKAAFDGKTGEPDPSTCFFIVKDDSEVPYRKLEHTTGKASADFELDSLPAETVSLGDTDYYQFDYDIEIDTSKYNSGDAILLEDTVPEDAVPFLQHPTEWWTHINGSYQYSFLNSYSELENSMSSNPTYESAYFDSDTHTLYLYAGVADNKPKTVSYSLFVPVSKVRSQYERIGEYILENRVQDNGNGKNAAVQYINIRKKTLTKTSAKEHESGNMMVYTLDLNPESEDIANGDTVKLTDVLTSGSRAKVVSAPDAAEELIDVVPNVAMNATLRTIEVYPVDENGNELPKLTSGFSYKITDGKVESVSSAINVQTGLGNYHSGNKYTYYAQIPNNSQKGAKTVIHISVPGGKLTWYDIKVNEVVNTDTVEVQNSYNYYYDYNNRPDSVDIPITLSRTLTGYSSFDIMFETDGSEDENAVSVTADPLASYSRDYVKKLELSVPDDQHLHIRYIYETNPSDPADKTNESFRIEAENSVSIDGSVALQTISDEKHDWIDLIDRSSGISEIANFNVEKVDAADYTVKLENARFKLWRYTPREDGSGYMWVGAESYNSISGKVVWSETEDAQAGNIDSAGSWEFATDSRGVFTLVVDDSSTALEKKGYLYMLVETASPQDYEIDSTPIYFAYSVNPSDDALPPGVSPTDYRFVENGSKLMIANFKKKISIEAEKLWSDGNDIHTGDTVTFDLYKAYRSTPSESELRKVEDRSGKAVSCIDGKWTYKWENLPSSENENGTGDARQLYYFVREAGSTAEGYTPVYTNNGLDRSGKVTVLNAKDLTVTKKWTDQHGEPLDEAKIPDEGAEFWIYTSNTSPQSSYRKDPETGVPVGSTLAEISGVEGVTDGYRIILNKSDFGGTVWQKKISGLPIKDSSDRLIYYYVYEKQTDEQAERFDVKISRNGAAAYGELTVTNKWRPYTVGKFSAKISKTWGDGETDGHLTDTLSFDLHRTTDKTKVPGSGDVNTYIPAPEPEGYRLTVNVLDYDGTAFPAEISGNTEYMDVKGETTVSLAYSNFYVYYSTAEYIQNGETRYGNADIVNGTVYYSLSVEEDTVLNLVIRSYGGQYGEYGVTLGCDNGRVYDPSYVPPGPTLTAAGSPAVFTEETFWKTVTLGANDGKWSGDFELEANDEEGQPYYYWIEEVKIGDNAVGVTHYTPYYCYSADDGLYISPENTSVTVFNDYDDTPGALMPETGGAGEKVYYFFGSALVITAGTFLYLKRRRHLIA